MMDYHTEDRIRHLAQEIVGLIRCNPETIIVLSHKGEIMIKPIGILNNNYIPDYPAYPHIGEVYTGLKTLKQCVTTPESPPKEVTPKINNQNYYYYELIQRFN